MATANHAARDSRAGAAQFTCGKGRAVPTPRLRAVETHPRRCRQRHPGAAALQPPTGPGTPGAPAARRSPVQPTPNPPLRGRGRAWRMTLAGKLPALRQRRGLGGGPAPLGAAASPTLHGGLGRAGRSRPPVSTAGARACRASQSPPVPARQVGARFRVPRPRRRDPAARTCAASPRGPSPAALRPGHPAPAPGPSGCCQGAGSDPGVRAPPEFAGRLLSSGAGNRRWVRSAPSPRPGVPPHESPTFP